MPVKLSILAFLGIATYLALLPQKNIYDQALLREIVETTKANHLQAKTLDDAFAQQFFELYLQELDPEKTFLTQKDIEVLKPYATQIDEELASGDYTFFVATQKLIRRAQQQVKLICAQQFTQGFDFTLAETLAFPSDKRTSAKDAEALKDRWRKKLKYELLELVATYDSSISLEERSSKAVEQLKASLAKRFARFENKSDEAWRDEYLNTYLKMQDVQTQFLSPEKKAEWTAAYTRRLVGLGLQVQATDAYPKVTGVTVGGPAWKTKQVSAGDWLISIQTAQGEAEDLYGKSLKQVLDLLRGTAGTLVELTIKQQGEDQSLQKLRMLREEIQFDLALSLVLSNPKSATKIGYLRLPRFYAGMEGSAEHVRQAIEALKVNEIEGLVFDVRNNQGGNARQAIDIISYFLDQGPIMKVQYQDGDERVYEDSNGPAIYDGPLIVLTNARSSSASELLVGTLQDYQRALIVGSKATYGKGTMQRFYSISVALEDVTKAAGEIKMSIGRFFTASGRSPQYTGVLADIVLPDEELYLNTGERRYPFALANVALPYEACSQNVRRVEQLESLQANSLTRQKANDRFQLAEEQAQLRKAQQSLRQISLQRQVFLQAQREERQATARFEKIYAPFPDFEVSLLAEEENLPDSLMQIQRKIPWQQQLQTDPYVYECYQIMQDMLKA